MDDLLKTVLNGHIESMRAGITAGKTMERQRLLPILKSIVAAYRHAALMPEARIPTVLEAAIHNAEGALLAIEEDDANAYAEAAIRRAKESTGEPRHDADTTGQPLRPGR